MEDWYQSDIVINAKKELKSVSNSLAVQSLGGSNEKLYSISTSIPIKGNTEIINKLIELGWEKTRRFKVQTNGSPRGQYEGYEMHQGFSKYFR